MLDIFVIGSILSTDPMLTSGIQRAHETCAHFCPDRVDFIAPPLFGQRTHSGFWPIEHVRHNHWPRRKRERRGGVMFDVKASQGQVSLPDGIVVIP